MDDWGDIHNFRMKLAELASLNKARAFWITWDLESSALGDQQGTSLWSREAAAPEEWCFFKHLLFWVLLLLFPTKVGRAGVCNLQKQWGVKERQK